MKWKIGASVTISQRTQSHMERPWQNISGQTRPLYLEWDSPHTQPDLAIGTVYTLLCITQSILMRWLSYTCLKWSDCFSSDSKRYNTLVIALILTQQQFSSSWQKYDKGYYFTVNRSGKTFIKQAAFDLEWEFYFWPEGGSIKEKKKKKTKGEKKISGVFLLGTLPLMLLTRAGLY